jgi:hypothetical protein
MTGLNHAATGALVAAAINRPLLALPAALTSHFLIDMIPHWDYKVPGGVNGRKIAMAMDLFLCFLLLLVLSLSVDATLWLIAAGGLLGILPDAMWLRFFMSGRPSISGNPKSMVNRVRKFHFLIQGSESQKGLFIEAAWLPLMVFLIYRIHH